ncbi:uncharacterized protein LOC119689082 [Teleopsis dalmanni]|uniref:uncharacterized protein LOC119689082 n=1 Tax=Teleopsis dalmanni TaxID=139649 RepID=UPI0018CF281D|nr:uncharacterized protein LOC119689082 [Teleopsis dalmanni]
MFRSCSTNNFKHWIDSTLGYAECLVRLEENCIYVQFQLAVKGNSVKGAVFPAPQQQNLKTFPVETRHPTQYNEQRQSEEGLKPYRYCVLFNSSQFGVERLEIYETKEDKNPKIVTMENCVKITLESSLSNTILVVKKAETLTLNALSKEDQKNWVRALQTVAFRDKNGSFNSLFGIEEDNDLYCSSYSDALYAVTLIPSVTSEKCNIEPKNYMLHLTTTELQLKSKENISIIATWPYRFIRKYGYRDGKFTFEAGRKCSTGEGIFILDHTNPKDIFRCMSSKMKSMKRLISTDKKINDENPLSAAVCMEARSRSPLIPSPTSQLSNSIHGNFSLKGLFSSDDFISNVVINEKISNMESNFEQKSVQLIPKKPNRKIFSLNKPISETLLLTQMKSLPHLTSQNNTQLKDANPNVLENSDSIVIDSSIECANICATDEVYINSKSNAKKLLINKIVSDSNYECIECITNAWKTLGIGEVNHTERLMNDTDDNYVIDAEKKSKYNKEPSIKNPQILDIDIGEIGNNNLTPDACYDHLDFLLPNNVSSSGYKTIVNVTGHDKSMVVNTTVFNEYESIESPEFLPLRKAEDSHIGYGVLRKKKTINQINC